MQEASGFVLRLYRRAQGVSTADRVSRCSEWAAQSEIRTTGRFWHQICAPSANKLSLQGVNAGSKLIAACTHKLERLFGL
ncbi:hypothetical protein PO909_010293 [Leuciscus waleckii]